MTFEALVQVIYHETWTVEAKDEAEAREKIAGMHVDVDTDDTGGEVTDWEVQKIKVAS